MNLSEAVRCAQSGSEYWATAYVVLQDRFDGEFYSMAQHETVSPTTGRRFSSDKVVYQCMRRTPG